MVETSHVPVLPKEVMELLDPAPGMICLDCTVGMAGHSAALAETVGPSGRLIGLDVDPTNLAAARSRLEAVNCRVDLVHANFAESEAVLGSLGVDRVDLVLADVGFSSAQMDDPQRGFSFATDGPLDMRFDRGRGGTAADLVNRLPQQQLADLIWKNGEERLSRKIARKIVERRSQNPILTTADLAGIVRAAYGAPRGRRSPGRRRIDPATRTFMALRIGVNHELESLEALLRSLPRLVRPCGRAAVISFHSLEDRLVKQTFAAFRRDGIGWPVTRKPVTADPAEREVNPRSRSAKLRVVELGPPPA